MIPPTRRERPAAARRRGEKEWRPLRVALRVVRSLHSPAVQPLSGATARHKAPYGPRLNDASARRPVPFTVRIRRTRTCILPKATGDDPPVLRLVRQRSSATAPSRPAVDPDDAGGDNPVKEGGVGVMGRSEGTIIVLNGASSAGKTTLARALQGVLAAPSLYVAGDTFVGMLPPGPFDAPSYLAVMALLPAFAASAASLGLNVVVDHLLSTRTWLKECAEHLAPHRAFLVGVRCSLEELERRERERGDRRVGAARAQLPFVHAHADYDVEVDTSAAPPEECARLIARRAEAGPEPAAFRRLLASPFLRDEGAYGWIWHVGSCGPGVRRLQDDLRRLGYDPGPNNGEFGPATEGAVRALQAAHGLRVDGMVWPRTITTIQRILADET